MLGKLYGIGVGPGDPELLTLKGARIIKECPVTAIADSGSENRALEIAGENAEGKEIIRCPMPMTKDEAVLESARRKSADMVKEWLDKGRDVAFITLGDPTVYSTYIYIHRLIKDAGYETEIIPGVTSFCAASAAFGDSLCDAGEPLIIIPGSYTGYEKLLDIPGSKVIMKSGKNIALVKEALRKRGVEAKAKLAEKCGMQGERLFEDIKQAPDDAGYFSLLMVKDGYGGK